MKGTDISGLNAALQGKNAMNMIEAVRVCFIKYAQFRGRARRAEFWWFMLFLFVLGIGVDLIDTMILGYSWNEYAMGPIDAVYILYTLATIIPSIFFLGIAVDLIDRMIFGYSWEEYAIGPMGAVYTLATIIPSIAVGVRRLHDTNRSGWWSLLVLVPLIGWIILIVWCAKSGDQEENRYGAAPI